MMDEAQSRCGKCEQVFTQEACLRPFTIPVLNHRLTDLDVHPLHSQPRIRETLTYKESQHTAEPYAPHSPRHQEAKRYPRQCLCFIGQRLFGYRPDESHLYAELHQFKCL